MKKSASIYEPKWASKPLQKRLIAIEQGIGNIFSYETKKRVHRDKINSIFGVASNPMSKFLIEQMLHETDFHVPGKESTEYVFSWNNLLASFVKAGLIPEDVALTDTQQRAIKFDKNQDGRQWTTEFITSRKAKRLFDLRFFEVYNSHLLTENATYVEDEETTRLLSDFQNKPRDIKAIFFRGWYDLDIDACAYCLTHQHLMNTVIPAIGKQQNSLYSGLLFNSDAKAAISEHFGSVIGKIDDVVKYEVWPKLYKQKKEMREYFANAWGVDVDTVKSVLASILFDAKLSHNPRSGVSKAVVRNGYDPEDFYKKADADPVLKKLLIELQDAWPKMMLYWNMSNEESGYKRFVRESVDKETGEISSRFRPGAFRARIYFELERKVLDVLRKNIDQDVIHLMHDGVIIKDEVKVDQLIKVVKDELGFDIKISMDKL